MQNPLPPRQRQGDAPETSGRLPPRKPLQNVLYHCMDRYIVVDKPADVRMDGDFDNTVESLIHAKISVDKAQGLRFVQRLDYATSGILLAALSKPAAAVAGAQFESRTVSKKYRALLHGSPPASGSWCWRIAEEFTEGFRMRPVEPTSSDGRGAHTDFNVLRRGTYRGATVALVEMTPRSGRRHQLRVHASTAGFPIVGDATYAGDESRYFGDNFEPPRMMLHATQLCIRLPDSHVPIRKWKLALKNAHERTFSSSCPFENMDGVSYALG